MVIFGGAGLRAATYATHGHWLLSVAEEENWVIHDVGPPMPESSMTNRLLNHGVCMHGRLDAAEIHLLLSEAAVGVLTYPQTYMSKSSVLGAYAAHALCPLALPVKGFRGEPRDLLVKGQNYVSSSEFIALDSTQIRDVGLAAWHWYQSHGVARHVGAVLKLSEDCCGLQ